MSNVGGGDPSRRYENGGTDADAHRTGQIPVVGADGNAVRGAPTPPSMARDTEWDRGDGRVPSDAEPYPYPPPARTERWIRSAPPTQETYVEYQAPPRIQRTPNRPAARTETYNDYRTQSARSRPQSRGFLPIILTAAAVVALMVAGLFAVDRLGIFDDAPTSATGTTNGDEPATDAASVPASPDAGTTDAQTAEPADGVDDGTGTANVDAASPEADPLDSGPSESSESTSASADTSSTETDDGVASDPDWPGGTGPVPSEPPQSRLAVIGADGTMTLTGSAPDWSTVSKIVQYAGEKLPGGGDAVDNQLTWHPDANADTQWGSVVMTDAVTFEAGGADLPTSGLDQLDLAAEMMSAHPTVFAVVIGHADNSGDEDDNAALASDRAQAVVDYLTDNGVVGGQIVVASAGEDDPMASNDTADGRAENRRVEILFKNVFIPELALAGG